MIEFIKSLEKEFHHNLAPVVGIVFGAFVSVRFGNPETLVFNAVKGCVVGFVSGCILWVLVHPQNAKEALW